MPSQGFAIRRGSFCLPQETPCGETVAPFRGCCPSGFACPKQYNVACCPPGRNCTTEIVNKPSCANATWDLYDNNGLFCCEPGAQGLDRGGSDGCAEHGLNLEGEATLLRLLRLGNATSLDAFSPPISASPSASPSPSSTPTPPPQPTKSSPPVGAIVGGVVGGIAAFSLIAVAFYLYRRKRRNPSSPEEPKYVYRADGQVAVYQLGDGRAVHETETREVKQDGGVPVRQLPIELSTN